MNQLEQLANNVGQCSKCLENGNLSEATKMLQQAQGDLKGLQQQLGEFQMVQDAMDQLDQARQQLACPHCNGEGCPFCQGDGENQGEPGMGLGKGPGRGPRPERETDYNTYDTRASVKTGKGAGMIVGETDGPNVKGNVQQKFVEQIESAKAQSADPLTEQRMSRKHHDHVREYFDRFRESR